MFRPALRTLAAAAILGVTALTGAAGAHAAELDPTVSEPTATVVIVDPCSDPLNGHSWDSTTPDGTTSATSTDTTSTDCDVATTDGHSWD